MLESILGNVNITITASSDTLSYITWAIRFILPVLAVLIMVRCVKSMLREKREVEIWGYLTMPNGGRVELNHWENIIGRAQSVDVQLNFPTVSRSHAALIRNDRGDWTIYDLNSKGGVKVNGHRVRESLPVKENDVLDLGGVDMVFIPVSGEEEGRQAAARQKQGRIINPALTLLLLTEFILFLAIQLCISYSDEFPVEIPECFIGLAVVIWIYYAVMKFFRRDGFEVETIAFLLCAIGLSVTASAAPDSLLKQFLCIVLGVMVFVILGIFLRDLDRAKALRWPMAIAAIAILALNMLLGEVVYGAQNWIYIGGVSIQPSEFVKIAFVFAGAATLDRLFARRNLILFIGISGVCVLALAYMGDFGTALIFFAAYLVIAFMRSGDLATVALSIGGAAFAGGLVIRFKPYIAERFSTWLNAWEYVNEGGYQQTRAMTAAASGGLFGVGAGEGWFKNITAADTDLVFGMVCEELGLIIGILMIAAVIVLALFAVRSAGNSRSSFYTIAACSSAAIMIFQMMLNVFGTVDLLPFTGVTFPFVSVGGSSMISCWGLLAFIKAIDTRQNASFAIKLPRHSRRYMRMERESEQEYDGDDYDYEDGGYYDDGYSDDRSGNHGSEKGENEYGSFDDIYGDMYVDGDSMYDDIDIDFDIDRWMYDYGLQDDDFDGEDDDY